MAIVTLKNALASFGEDVVLDHVDLVIEAGERLCLSGRNGSGKSTLLKILSNEKNLDDGQLWRQEKLVFSTLEQDLPENSDKTVFEVVAGVFESMGEKLAEYHRLAHELTPDAVDRFANLQQQIEAGDGWSFSHRIDSILDKLKLDGDVRLDQLSGGWRKRVAIARSLVRDPDVWLLDEPTNHLDIPMIQWLENLLLDFEGTIIFVSHDRELMRSVATGVVDIDRGRLTKWECGYDEFIERRDHQREVEETHNKKFDERLKKEEIWIRQGIKARRTRNEGRVRDLEKMRVERASRRTSGQLKMAIDSGDSSGKIVKELIHVKKSFGDDEIISDFSLIVQRGDRIGMVGPNGCGKSTLIKLMLEEIKPDAGEVKTGTKLKVAYFDQLRDKLNPEMSVSDYISEGREYIDISGKSTHVVTYLGNFMFSPDQSRAPIRTLSGGEQNRLLLARLFSLPANLLVLDEPTNDLDIESLELLEEMLLTFDGTVLIVSHDRLFMDNVVSSLLVFDGNGYIEEHVGGYSDWQTYQKAMKKAFGNKKKDKSSSKSSASASQNSKGFGDNGSANTVDEPISHEERKKQKADRKKLEKEMVKLPQQIEKDEAKVTELQKQMAEDSFYAKSSEEQAQVYDGLKLLETQIDTAMTRWAEVEELLENTAF
ncbi:MAG: ATP-binding cassette domain-containing protein [Pseudomonadales bacterium]|nr:ATP-binding cassette domain-containing protein [Pseudomonadales bacterium]